MVICQLPDGHTLPDQNCDILERPASSRRCNLEPCLTSVVATSNEDDDDNEYRQDPQWKKGLWSRVRQQIIHHQCHRVFTECRPLSNMRQLSLGECHSTDTFDGHPTRDGIGSVTIIGF